MHRVMVERPPAVNYTWTTGAATMQECMGTEVVGHRSKGTQEDGGEGVLGAVYHCMRHYLYIGLCLFYGDEFFFILMYRLRKESIAGIPSHHHTVHSGTDLNSCHLCAQAQTKRGRRQSRTPRFKQRPGEQTVFSVGRLVCQDKF